MMKNVVALFVLFAILGTAECAVAANPVGGKFDYPLNWSLVYSSYGFTVTGSTWEIIDDNPPWPDYVSLNYKVKLYDSTSDILKEISGTSNEWGGYYDYVPAFKYAGPTAYLEFWVQDADSTWNFCDSVMLNVQYAP